MKRFVLMLLAIGALGIVLGCNKDKDKADDTAAAKPVEGEAEEAKEEAKEEAEEAKEEGGDEAEGASADTGVAECDAYIAAFEKFMACDGVPDQAKEATKQSVDAMKEGWSQLSDPNVPEAARQAAADGCKQGEDALKQSASALGCEI